MGIASSPEKTRTLFVIKSDKSRKHNFSDMFSGSYDLIETTFRDDSAELLRKHFGEISLIVIDTADNAEVSINFIREIEADQKFRAVPVIVIADDSLEKEEERFLAEGVSAFTTYSTRQNLILLQTANLINLRENAETGIVSDIDEVTGLFNRFAFFRVADTILEDNPDDEFVIYISEVDGIKGYNEKNGKEAGDALLRTIGEYMRNIGDECLAAGRFAGDQFVSLFRKDEKLNSRLLELNVNEAYSFFKGDAGIDKLRIRCAIYEDIEHGIPISETCDRALLALQTIRGKYGKTIVHYEASVLSEHRKKERIEDSMKEALEQNQFRVFYQPKHDVNTGELTGAEALIRWVHPDFGFMSPGEFIPVFEQNGFISEVDNFVWNRTCQNLNRWINKGLKVVPISINASKIDFMKPDFFDNLHRASTEMNVPPQLLHIEVTESLFTDQMDELVEILTKCQKNGYKIELDDFGSGYSSLNTLSVLPLDIVKMDMSLVKAITNFKNMRVFSACINLAKSLGLKTVSEGVETNEQMWTIRELGGDAIQGYLYSKPLSEDDFEKYLIE
ncbi:MAG: EAL domain-containing protein, partial [Oscillospiraceae bacterium]|nr:EAL domain-containing protein [Oscillospiraceae bacterium]